jgi:succinate dehydrogenase / fumarate reductase cytochrome b subunit
VISQGRVGVDTLDDLFDFFHNPVLVFLELMLVAAVLYHALNGVRIILMDLGVGIRQHKVVFWVCMVVAAATLAVFSWKAFPSIF